MTRQEGVKAVYLVKMNKDNEIEKAIKFVDDYRPQLKKDERYAVVQDICGDSRYNFDSKEDGNNFYRNCLILGCVKGNEKQFREIGERSARWTY